MADAAATIVFLGGAIATFAVPWSAARLADKRVGIANEKYKVFLTDRKRLGKLRQELGSESWRWPIYVRPVLFTSIDQVAQVHFSNAESALQESEELAERIQPPPILAQTFFEKYHPANNVRIIASCMRLEDQVGYFSHLLNSAWQQINYLRQEHKKENGLQQGVRRSLTELKNRAIRDIQASSRVSLTATAKSRMDWAINTIENSVQMAGERIEAQYEDGGNFAAVFLLVRLANYILDNFNLYSAAHTIPARFEADHFDDKLNKLETTLKMIISDSSLQDWHALYMTNCLLELAGRKIDSAKRSLLGFFEMQKVFLANEQAFLAIDLHGLIKEAETLQVDCVQYWMTPEEGPDFWTSALNNHKLPNMAFENARRFHQANIAPSITHGAVIKQRSLPQIIHNLKLILVDIQAGKDDMTRLRKQLDVHRAAHKIVVERLGENGDVRRSVKALEKFQGNTERGIRDICMLQRQLFDQYLQKTNAVRGANFPKMLSRLDKLVSDCAQSVQKHESLIINLKAQNQTYAMRLQALYSEIVRLQTQRPGIDWDWNSVLAKINAAIQKHKPGSADYSELVEYSSAAVKILENAARDRDQIVLARKSFEERHARTGVRLGELEKALVGYDQFSNTAWQWAKNKFIRDLQPLQRQYQMLQKNWSQSLTLDTAQQALGICEYVEREVDKAFRSINDTIEVIKKQHDEFVSNYNYYMERASSFGIFNIPGKSGRLINTLCDYARVVPDSRDVVKLFQCADDLLRRSITKDEIINIENLIQDFSQRIENLTVNDGVVNIAPQINQYRTPPSKMQ